MADRNRDIDHDRDRDRNRDRDDRRPSKDMPRFTGRDDSRVGDHEFTFEHSHQPQGGDSYRPNHDDRDDRQRSRAPPSGPRGGRGRGGPRGGRGGYGRGRGSGDGKPFVFIPAVPAHERPILYFDAREKTPELMAGMALGSGDRFKEDVEEQNEDQGEEEAEEEEGVGAVDRDKDTPMEISDNENEAGGTTQKAEVEGEPKPEKKPDVISMIRAFKSKTAATQRNAVVDNDDFIPLSFDNEDDPKDESESELEPEPEQGRKMRRANDGHRIVEHHGRERADSDPRFSHRDHHYQERQPARDVGPPGATTSGPAAALPPPPSLGDHGKDIAARELLKAAQTSFKEGTDIPWPPPPPPMDRPLPPPPPPSDSPLGELDIPKKRKYADFTVRGNNQIIDGNIREKYRLQDGGDMDPVPWVRHGADHSRCSDMADWLHKEITDFISYIQPRAYEHAVRRDLVNRVRTVITRIWPDTDVRVFGSFAAELYLPTSDVDLVVVSQSYAWYNIPKYTGRRYLAKLGNDLRAVGMNNVQVVAKAKVPIVKFVDRLTGISVDISFENASGMVANETFLRWKKAYPAMPILVLLIKHFLAIRGLNEPYIGGLGSFSVTCLVISLLQLLPSVRSGRIEPRLHLGVILLEFFELYGKNFNTEVVGIRVDEDAPGYFLKKGVFNANDHLVKSHQLVIQDPNDPTNDVSKSSYAIRLILSCFAEAYDALISQMSLLDRLPFSQRVGRSILGVIIGGNYYCTERQRVRMQEVYTSEIGPLEGAEATLRAWEAEETVRKAKLEAERPKDARRNAGGQHADGPRDGVRNGELRDKTTARDPDTESRKTKVHTRKEKRGVARSEIRGNRAATKSEALHKGKDKQEIVVID